MLPGGAWVITRSAASFMMLEMPNLELRHDLWAWLCVLEKWVYKPALGLVRPLGCMVQMAPHCGTGHRTQAMCASSASVACLCSWRA